MIRISLLIALTIVAISVVPSLLPNVPKEEELVSTPSTESSHALNYEMNTLSGEKVNLAEKYENKVVLVVNVASRCGLTPQYKDLQALHQKYEHSGLAVLGFPCNQFGMQEPGTAEEIQDFCEKNYGVTFDLFEKVNVNGKDACDLYKQLTSVDTHPTSSGKITWNFEKFLIGRDGQVIARYSPQTPPSDNEFIAIIESSLQ